MFMCAGPIKQISILTNLSEQPAKKNNNSILNFDQNMDKKINLYLMIFHKNV